MSIYSHNDDELDAFLEKENARKKKKKKYTLKLITSKLKRKDKLKIILYRISPRLYRYLLKTHLKRKR